MTLLPAAFADWESLWAESLTTPVHVFVTVGKASAVVCDYNTPIRTWMGRFCLCHVDEATQVLRSNSLHLFRFLTKSGKLLLSGDTFQLSAYRGHALCTFLASVATVELKLYFVGRTVVDASSGTANPATTWLFTFMTSANRHSRP